MFLERLMIFWLRTRNECVEMVREDEYHSRYTNAMIEYWSNDAWSVRWIVEIVPFVSTVLCLALPLSWKIVSKTLVK